LLLKAILYYSAMRW